MRKELIAFNRGRISPLALARNDFKRTALSAEIQTNWMPRTLGSMMLRPGIEYTGATKNDALSVSLPFIFATDDTARCELTDNVMRVWVDDVLVTRPSVTSAITNGSFASDLAGWTDEDAGTSASAWATGGYLSLIGSSNAAAKRRQEVTTIETGVRHSLDITIERGTVLLRVGTSAGDDDYIRETTLYPGSHSLSLTPTGNFWIDLFSYSESASLVSSIEVAGPGVMELVAPWAEADLRSIRWDQSGDVIFAACPGYRQHRIERRAVDSWSIVEYLTDDGPFRVQNVGPITLMPASTSGDTTLTASAALFRSTHVGALFKLEQTGQSATADITASDQYSDPIRVTGVDGTRAFAIIITGTWVGTITLQYSVGDPGDWVDATSGTFTGNTSISYDDTLDNQVIYYRIGAKSGAFTSGTASVSLSSSSGSQSGVGRVTAFNSSTSVNVGVLSEFGGTGATSTWFEGDWSDRRGWPSSVAFYEGRLWWAGSDKIKGSISDGFSSYDDEFVGDAGPIQRSIGSGPVANINWMLPLQRLLLGADGSIWSARSSSFDEPLTPTNFNLKDVSTQGANAANAVKIDTGAIFVQRSGVRVYEAEYDGSAYDYAVKELTTHIPEIGEPGIIRTAVQMQPEKRVHCARSDGTVAILIYDKAEEVVCWVDFETDGEVEDIVILPGTDEDQVYYQVKRTINGATERYHEKWANESDCQGSTLNKQADAFLSGSGSGSLITGLDHLEGETVVCWADGMDKGTFTVSGGSISVEYTQGYVVGLAYEARFKSTKLSYTDPEGNSALCDKKRVSQLGVIAQNMHSLGLQYGPDFDTLDDMPTTEKYETVGDDTIWAQYDEELFSFTGEWDTDSRLCLKASAPRPVTLLAAIVEMEVNKK